MLQGSLNATAAALGRDKPHSLRELHDSIANFVKHVQSVDIRKFETLSTDQLWTELVPKAKQLMDEARAIVRSALEICEKPRGTAPQELKSDLTKQSRQFEFALDVAVEIGVGGLQALEDISFLVQMELRHRSQRCEALTPNLDAAIVITECDRVLRGIRKGMGAIDLAIAKAEGTPPKLNFSSELQDSRRVREVYAWFREGILSGGEVTESTILQRMRMAGTQMAMLIGREEYPCLRTYDRLHLRGLQQRVLTWLLPENREDTTTGAILWQEIMAFTEFLAQVNKRQELGEHDAWVIAEALENIGQGKDIADPKVIERIKALTGMDDDLDRLLHRKGGIVSRDEWKAVLQRLGANIGVAPGSPS